MTSKGERSTTKEVLDHVRLLLIQLGGTQNPTDDPAYTIGYHAALRAVMQGLGLDSTQTQKTDDAVGQEARAVARALLHQMMSHISEDRWCAGWLVNLEHILWAQVLDSGQRVAQTAQDAEAQQLAYLAHQAGGWWRFDEEACNEVFVPLQEWTRLHQEYEVQRRRQQEEHYRES